MLLERFNSIAFDNIAYKWFQSYLMARQQCVVIGNIKSEFVQIAKGVPQGSILGPVPFTLYKENIASSVTGCNIHQYADDGCYYFTSLAFYYFYSLLPFSSKFLIDVC